MIGGARALVVPSPNDDRLRKMDQVVHVLERLRIGRCVAMVDDDEYKELMARKTELPKTRFGDCYDPEHVESISRLTRRV